MDYAINGHETKKEISERLTRGIGYYEGTEKVRGDAPASDTRTHGARADASDDN